EFVAQLVPLLRLAQIVAPPIQAGELQRAIHGERVLVRGAELVDAPRLAGEERGRGGHETGRDEVHRNDVEDEPLAPDEVAVPLHGEEGEGRRGGEALVPSGEGEG